MSLKKIMFTEHTQQTNLARSLQLIFMSYGVFF